MGRRRHIRVRLVDSVEWYPERDARPVFIWALVRILVRLCVRVVGLADREDRDGDPALLTSHQEPSRAIKRLSGLIEGSFGPVEVQSAPNGTATLGCS